jgi:hypothetical protein
MRMLVTTDRDSKQPSWSGMPKGIGAVIGVHRYRTTNIQLCEQFFKGLVAKPVENRRQ